MEDLGMGTEDSELVEIASHSLPATGTTATDEV